MTKAKVTTATRRLCRQHNSDELVNSGNIYQVDLDTGNIGRFVSNYAAIQPSLEMRRAYRHGYLRISYGRMTEADAQRFLDDMLNVEHPAW